MVNVQSKRCGTPGCPKLQPKFGHPGGRPLHCGLHAAPGMVDVVSKRCEAAGCGKTPSYGPPGGRRTYCATHAEKGMVDARTKRCGGHGGDVHGKGVAGAGGGAREDKGGEEWPAPRIT